MEKSNTRILTKAVEAAVAFDFRCPQWYHDLTEARSIIYHHVIFNHEFVKALAKYLLQKKPNLVTEHLQIPVEEKDETTVEAIKKKILVEMVLEVEPLKYLEKFFKAKS